MKVSQLMMPILFVSGLADTLVPPRMMADLHQQCSSHHKQLLQFETGTHNETWNCPGYYHALANFLNDARIRRVDGRTSVEAPSVQLHPIKPV